MWVWIVDEDSGGRNGRLVARCRVVVVVVVVVAPPGTGRKSTVSPSAMVWESLDDLRSTEDISKLCHHSSSPRDGDGDGDGDEHCHPRLAKDVEYASSVLKAWRDEVEGQETGVNVGSRFAYHEIANGNGNGNGGTLNGYLVAPSNVVLHARQNWKEKEKIPAIILFHTGAGPQDVFLRWKADMLARELKCAVLIADIISDAEGYAWHDRERYDSARRSVLRMSKDGDGGKGGSGKVARWKLRGVIAAAIDNLQRLEFVEGRKMAAIGWCMGGHPILELGLMQKDCVKSLVSYHGVFDGVQEYETSNNGGGCSKNVSMPGPPGENTETERRQSNTQVLICNGGDDPFVQNEDVEATKRILISQGCDVTVLHFDKVKHGFTNPAQDFNPSDSFAFNESAAKQSWESTLLMLRQTLYDA